MPSMPDVLYVRRESDSDSEGDTFFDVAEEAEGFAAIGEPRLVAVYRLDRVIRVQTNVEVIREP